MKKYVKFLLCVFVSTMIFGSMAFATEEKTEYIWYTNSDAALYTSPDLNTIAVGAELIEDGLPIFVKGFTENDFYIVNVGMDIDYYVPMYGLNRSKLEAISSVHKDLAIDSSKSVKTDNSVYNLSDEEKKMKQEKERAELIKKITEAGAKYGVTFTDNTVTISNPTWYSNSNTGFEENTGLAIVPEGMLTPHQYGTLYYSHYKNNVVVNSDTDPYSVFLNDNYDTVLHRLEMAQATGLNYYIGIRYGHYVYDENGKNAAFEDFALKYKITHYDWKYVDQGYTTMWYDGPYDNMNDTTKDRIIYEIIVW